MPKIENLRYSDSKRYAVKYPPIAIPSKRGTMNKNTFNVENLLTPLLVFGVIGGGGS